MSLPPTTATPAIRRIWNATHVRYPSVRSMGVFNCRPIAGSDVWSQHAWGNAWDITSPWLPRVAWNPLHMRYMDELVAWLRSNADELQVQWIGWRIARHFDHAHVQCWPRGIRTPPCADGSLVVLHKSGKIGNMYTEAEMTLKPGDTGDAVAAFQLALNKQNPNLKLKVDGVYGESTGKAVADYQTAADILATGEIDGVTAALLSRYDARVVRP